MGVTVRFLVGLVGVAWLSSCATTVGGKAAAPVQAAGPVTATVGFDTGSRVIGKRFAVLEFKLVGGAETAEDQRALQALQVAADEARTATVRATRSLDAVVMTRENMLELVRSSGGQCREGECEIETGRNLGADYIVTGDLVRLREFNLTLKLFDVRTGSLIAQTRVKAPDGEGMVEGAAEATKTVLSEGLQLGRKRPAPTVARQGVGTVEQESQELPEETVQLGIVEFTSNPPGALVRVDDTVLCQKTPCSRQLPTGKHELVVELERYEKLTTELLVGSGKKSVPVKLKPTFGWLVIESTGGEEVPVKINGEAAGRTPLRLEKDPGEYLVTIEDPCWLLRKETGFVNAAEEKRIELRPERRVVKLQVTAERRNGDALEGEASVDGEPLGRVPDTFKVSTCASELLVRTELGIRKKPLELRKADERAVAKIALEFDEKVVERASPVVATPARTDFSVLRMLGGITVVTAALPLVLGGVGLASTRAEAAGLAPGDPRAAELIETGKGNALAVNVGLGMLALGAVAFFVF
ncbi:MAG: hypothetical protein RL653_4151 [Pseudomonadota bacterium]|jgi:hypothetical protein